MKEIPSSNLSQQCSTLLDVSSVATDDSTTLRSSEEDSSVEGDGSQDSAPKKQWSPSQPVKFTPDSLNQVL